MGTRLLLGPFIIPKPSTNHEVGADNVKRKAIPVKGHEGS
jgi:hypothetical protein